MKNNLYGEQFLDKLYKNLYMSDEVQHTKGKNDSRVEAIKKYLERLEKVHRNANTSTKKRILEHFYYKKYVVKEKNLPEYVDKQIIIKNQKKSLKMWLDYLSNPTANYPTWAKYWAFQGMLKMGAYDEFSGEYQKRDKKTIAPFVEANPEIIAKCIGTIIKLINGEEITENIEEKISKTDSFKKIYQIFEKQFKNNKISRTSNEGIWIKYNQGNKEDAIKLAKSLENKNTGWCTANEDTAISQVCGSYGEAPDGGDFYVYYTKDKKENFSIPRIALRLIDHNEIGEIRGVEEGQNLEECMVDILESKLKEMTFLSKRDVKKYMKKIADLRELSYLIKKNENNEKLTKKEINNLYTKDYGFGWELDARAYRLMEKNKRFLKDLNIVKDQSTKEWIIYTFVDCIKPNSISDKEDIITLINNHVDIEKVFEIAKPKFKKDRDVALAAVTKDFFAFYYLNPSFVNDRDFVLEAIKSTECDLASYDVSDLLGDLDEYYNDHEIFLRLIQGRQFNFETKEQLPIMEKSQAYKLIMEIIEKHNYSFESDKIKLDEKNSQIVEIKIRELSSDDNDTMYIKMDYNEYQEYLKELEINKIEYAKHLEHMRKFEEENKEFLKTYMKTY